MVQVHPGLYLADTAIQTLSLELELLTAFLDGLLKQHWVFDSLHALTVPLYSVLILIMAFFLRPINWGLKV